MGGWLQVEAHAALLGFRQQEGLLPVTAQAAAMGNSAPGCGVCQIVSWFGKGSIP